MPVWKFLTVAYGALLSAIVVRAGEQYPGPGFYNLARRLKPQYAEVDDITLYALEFKAVQNYWQKVN
jgi:hypothetical protein